MPTHLNDLMYAYFGGTPSLPDAAYAYYKAAQAAGVTGIGIVNGATTYGAYRPTGALAETYSRVNGATDQALLSTGRLSLQAIPLAAGQVITSITFMSGTTALSVGSNQWFALFDSSRNKLAITTDGTSGAWAANSTKTLNLSPGTFTTTYTGLYYLGICVVATTPPSLAGMSTGAAIGPVLDVIAPAIGGTSSTGLTNPASCPSQAAAITGGPGHPYAYVS